MPCGWEGNRRSGVALAMRHRLQWFIRMRAHGLRTGDEHPTYSPLYPHVCLRTSSVQSNLAKSRIAVVRERRFTVPIYFTVEMDRQISAISAASLFLYTHTTIIFVDRDSGATGFRRQCRMFRRKRQERDEFSYRLRMRGLRPSDSCSVKIDLLSCTNSNRGVGTKQVRVILRYFNTPVNKVRTSS